MQKIAALEFAEKSDWLIMANRPNWLVKNCKYL